jgi:hypothetical protein
MSSSEWAKREASSKPNRWVHAVEVTRAWRVVGEPSAAVEDLAPDATKTKAWQSLGALGARLNEQEAQRFRKLKFEETSVYSRVQHISSPVESGNTSLVSSRAGPVPKTPHWVEPAEGPKRLYVLKLEGDANAFLNRPTGGKLVVKVGFSGEPRERCEAFNSALPGNCAFQWKIMKMGPQHRSSDHAIAGENKIKELLNNSGGESLGREFFLAEVELVLEAFDAGVARANSFRSRS